MGAKGKGILEIRERRLRGADGSSLTSEWHQWQTFIVEHDADHPNLPRYRRYAAIAVGEDLGYIDPITAFFLQLEAITQQYGALI